MSEVDVCEKIVAEYKGTMEYVEWLRWNISQLQKELMHETDDFRRSHTAYWIEHYKRALRENMEYLLALSQHKCIAGR